MVLEEIKYKVLSYCDLPEELTEDHYLSDYGSSCYVVYSLDEGEPLDDWIAKHYPELKDIEFMIAIDY